MLLLASSSNHPYRNVDPVLLEVTLHSKLVFFFFPFPTPFPAGEDSRHAVVALPCQAGEDDDVPTPHKHCSRLFVLCGLAEEKDGIASQAHAHKWLAQVMLRIIPVSSKRVFRSVEVEQRGISAVAVAHAQRLHQILGQCLELNGQRREDIFLVNSIRPIVLRSQSNPAKLIQDFSRRRGGLHFRPAVIAAAAFVATTISFAAAIG
mmetsp:Transcript_10850/g.20487  ORF Transcript_10850/g.20487 Transcript_10850/m.20487 type:complete len:206 (+) Transcript_10850:93-710(+)